ncbi:hypothetical protein [Humisphaera borealis]|uniref:Uncharacterized protein n=1 Tax=Humisphaera borealis TaxID=2807512 RepID=A0A7M2WR36_9BACT|nr:hypothetical protein [Humisphaera borealis]QOV87936.1 hypothetical protein IPV69_16885 [Humisphaera borealis]
MPPTPVEPLESRTLFAAGPLLTSAIFVGDYNAITAVVIGFDRALDPTTAQDLKNYKLFGTRNNHRVDDLRFAAASYNATDFTVTLTRTDLFSLRFFRHMRIEISGNKTGDVADVSGNLVDGNRDGTSGGNVRFTLDVRRRRGLAYKDDDGDRVKLKARGAEGRRPLYSLSYKGTIHQLWLDGTNNTLLGTIKATKKSDGIVHIGRVVLVHPSNVNALPAEFVVGQTVSDGQAPVDPLIRTF